MSHIIYKVSNSINDRLYVGCTASTWANRWNEHLQFSRSSKSANVPFYQDIRAYGADKFTGETIEADLSEDIVLLREQYWIRYLNTKCPHGYNQRVYKLSDEDVAIIRFNAFNLTQKAYASLYDLHLQTVAFIRSSKPYRTYRHVTQEHLPVDLEAYRQSLIALREATS